MFNRVLAASLSLFMTIGLSAHGLLLPAEKPPVLTLDLRQGWGLSRGVPGARAGSSVLPGPHYELPVRLTSVTIEPDGEGLEQWFVEVVVTNDGPLPYDLAVARENKRTHADGRFGRRTVTFAVEAIVEGVEQPEHWGGAVTFAATDAGGSFVRLQPQQSVKVLLPLSIPSKYQRGGDNRNVQLRVRCDEKRIADTSYTIEQRSARVLSQEVPFSAPGGS